eukprot:CAMPEP_0114239348 /NCGR_PEP_ID=MMETSP0058-20121206/8410_1 /TAXON_ID=36894 /ORGANISM="Pyramimonas parkeae, CCMP726" /LENGTH=514 /DNA_ID=CAMNT_0001351519 /DNA_START=430 /DNA_END=1974 /DNA_ORIENTATION=-
MSLTQPTSKGHLAIRMMQKIIYIVGWVRRKIGTRFPSPAMVLSGTTCLSVLCVVLIDVQQNLYISRDGARPSSSGENELLVGGSNWPAGVWWEHTALKSWQGCVPHPSGKSKAVVAPRGYLKVTAQGGVMQQRQQICDGVALARYLGARLIVPELAYNEDWKDNTTFRKVFDLPFFVESLKKDVVVMEESKINKNAKVGIVEVNPPTDGKLAWFDTNVRPLLNDEYLVRLVTMVDRLEFENIPMDMQRLRCRACFHALQWSGPVVKMGADLLDRMQDEADLHTNSLRFVSVHMPAQHDTNRRAACASSVGAWLEHLGSTNKLSESSSAEVQQHVLRCPVTLDEIALFLKALGYPTATPVYLAGHDLPEGDALKPLASAYPNIYSKSKLFSKKELFKYSKSSTWLAALDYVVCLHSTVFVSTHSSMMADFLLGERTYFGRGLSVHPHKASLVKAMLQVEQNVKLFDVFKMLRQKHSHVHKLFPRATNNSHAESNVYWWPLSACMCTRNRGKQLDS